MIAGKGCTDAGAKVVPKRGYLACESDVWQKKVVSDGSSKGAPLDSVAPGKVAK